MSGFPMKQCLLLPTGRLGPRFCFSEAAELRYCNGSSGAPSDRSCSSDEVCTSPCLCWNGQSRSPNDTVAFTGASIDEQGEPLLLPRTF